jgi:hypothetical protein
MGSSLVLKGREEGSRGVVFQPKVNDIEGECKLIRSEQMSKNAAKAPSKFLSDLRIDFGPPEQLGRFFVAADLACRSRGVDVEIGSMQEMLAVNDANSDSWRPLVSAFDPRNWPDDNNAFCVLGRNMHGEVVAAHAARYYDWTNGETFYSEGTSLRMFYPNPESMKRVGEELTISAPESYKITGRVVYSGAAWVRPDYRGRRISSVFPKICKAIAYTKYNPDVICSVMNRDVHSKGFAPRFDYPNVNWDVHWINGSMGSHRYAIVWMTGADIIQTVAHYLSAAETAEIAVQRHG